VVGLAKRDQVVAGLLRDSVVLCRALGRICNGVPASVVKDQLLATIKFSNFSVPSSFEPDDLILGLLERWLGEAGYIVVVETSQRLPEAVGDGREPHLVIIDVPTPRSAEKVINSVREVHAGPILLLFARFRRGMGSSTSMARQLGVRNVLPKPFMRGELLSAVGESIDGT
jgi:hypothetical protein